MREVKLATVETDGRVSVLKQDWAEELQKGEVTPEMKQQRQADTGGQEKPPPDKQTDSDYALGHAR